MKFIAKKNFYRVPALEAIDFTENGDFDQPHENHVSKGTSFDLGTFKDLTELNQSPRTQDKHLAAELIVSGCVVAADDTKAVKKIQDELKAEEMSRRQAEKANTLANGTAVVNQLLELLQKLSVQAPPKSAQ